MMMSLMWVWATLYSQLEDPLLVGTVSTVAKFMYIAAIVLGYHDIWQVHTHWTILFPLHPPPSLLLPPHPSALLTSPFISQQLLPLPPFLFPPHSPPFPLTPHSPPPPFTSPPGTTILHDNHKKEFSVILWSELKSIFQAAGATYTFMRSHVATPTVTLHHMFHVATPTVGSTEYIL